MSYFLFGTFNEIFDQDMQEKVKKYGESEQLYIWFNEEITFYEEINRMLLEQGAKGNTIFAITSVNQRYNSDDVLFPFDKYSNEILFADKSRKFYKKCCQENLEILFTFFKKLKELSQTIQMKIFVVEGYDDMFFSKSCTLDEMKKDLLYQIEEKASINSYIYIL
jgi:hypothetical protein